MNEQVINLWFIYDSYLYIYTGIRMAYDSITLNFDENNLKTQYKETFIALVSLHLYTCVE